MKAPVVDTSHEANQIQNKLSVEEMQLFVAAREATAAHAAWVDPNSHRCVASAECQTHVPYSIEFKGGATLLSEMCSHGYEEELTCVYYNKAMVLLSNAVSHNSLCLQFMLMQIAA